MFFDRKSNIFEKEPEEYKYLTEFPPKKGIYVVLDTENIKTRDGKDIMEIKADLIEIGDMDTFHFRIYINSSISTQNTLKIDDKRNIQSSLVENYLSQGNKRKFIYCMGCNNYKDI